MEINSTTPPEPPGAANHLLFSNLIGSAIAVLTLVLPLYIASYYSAQTLPTEATPNLTPARTARK